MTTTFDFLHKVIDSLSEHIAVIDESGDIVFVNQAWIRFGQKSGWPDDMYWLGLNYLKVCEDASQAGEQYGRLAANGIREVLSGATADFYIEYPCHSADEYRWFMMRVGFFEYQTQRYAVITHQNITERRNAEDQVRSLSQQDALTGLANRRHFDAFLAEEWRRCARLGQPLTLVMLDIDHFKALNDCYGHLVGDQCLVSLCNEIRQITRRPGELAARFGGDEFILVFSQSDPRQVHYLVDTLLRTVTELKIPNMSSPTAPFVTCSAGMATAYPHAHSHPNDLIDLTDKTLYIAKTSGRNRLHCAQHVAAGIERPGQARQA